MHAIESPDGSTQLPSACWILGVGLVFYLPSQMLALFKLQGGQAAAFGAGTGVLGLLLATIGFISKQGPAWRQKAESFADKTGMRIADLLSIVFIVLFLTGLSYAITAMMRLHEPYLKAQEARLGVDVQAPAFSRMVCAKLKAQDPETRFSLGSSCRPLDCGHAGKRCAPWTDEAAHFYTASLLTTIDPLPRDSKRLATRPVSSAGPSKLLRSVSAAASTSDWATACSPSSPTTQIATDGKAGRPSRNASNDAGESTSISCTVTGTP